MEALAIRATHVLPNRQVNHQTTRGEERAGPVRRFRDPLPHGPWQRLRHWHRLRPMRKLGAGEEAWSGGVRALCVHVRHRVEQRSWLGPHQDPDFGGWLQLLRFPVQEERRDSDQLQDARRTADH